LTGATGYKTVKYFDSTNYKANDELTNEVFFKYKFKDEGDGDKIKRYAAGYQIRTNDRVIVLSFAYVGNNENDFEKYLMDFQANVVVGLTLGRAVKHIEPVSAASPAKTKKDEVKKQQPKEIRNIGKKYYGKILLRVESGGEAWYLSQATKKAHFLGRPEDAFYVMRELGLGISEASFKSFNGFAPSNLAGKILMRVGAHGEAYYVNPSDKKLYYLGRPADAFSVMRKLGLGISNKNFDNL
jgi:hypothetical protein